MTRNSNKMGFPVPTGFPLKCIDLEDVNKTYANNRFQITDNTNHIVIESRLTGWYDFIYFPENAFTTHDRDANIDISIDLVNIRSNIFMVGLLPFSDCENAGSPVFNRLAYGSYMINSTVFSEYSYGLNLRTKSTLSFDDNLKLNIKVRDNYVWNTSSDIRSKLNGIDNYQMNVSPFDLINRDIYVPAIAIADQGSLTINNISTCKNIISEKD